MFNRVRDAPDCTGSGGVLFTRTANNHKVSPFHPDELLKFCGQTGERFPPTIKQDFKNVTTVALHDLRICLVIYWFSFRTRKLLRHMFPILCPAFRTRHPVSRCWRQVPKTSVRDAKFQRNHPTRTSQTASIPRAEPRDVRRQTPPCNATHTWTWSRRPPGRAPLSHRQRT